MGYPMLYQQPNSAVIATLAVRFPAVSHPIHGSKLGVIFDVRSGQAHIFVGSGLTLALRTTSLWHGLSNAISTTHFGGRSDARRPFLDRFAPNNDNTLGALSQHHIKPSTPFCGGLGSSLL